MTDLRDWGGGVPEPEPPHIQKRKRIPYSVGEKRITAGWIGPVPERECRGFVTKRDEYEHRIRALDAYGISVAVLRRLVGKGVELVLIHEAQSDRVLEYTLEQFLEGSEVPDQYLMRSDDPQRYVERDSVQDWWQHGRNLYLARDERVEYE